MVSIVTAQKEVLLNPQGTEVWSGQTVQVTTSNEECYQIESYLAVES